MPRRKVSEDYKFINFPEVNCSICNQPVKYEKYAYLHGFVSSDYVYNLNQLVSTVELNGNTYKLYGLTHLDCYLGRRMRDKDLVKGILDNIKEKEKLNLKQ